MCSGQVTCSRQNGPVFTHAKCHTAGTQSNTALASQKASVPNLPFPPLLHPRSHLICMQQC